MGRTITTSASSLRSTCSFLTRKGLRFAEACQRYGACQYRVRAKSRPSIRSKSKSVACRKAVISLLRWDVPTQYGGGCDGMSTTVSHYSALPLCDVQG
eukprot:3498826-Rhodomonas_salina.2